MSNFRRKSNLVHLKNGIEHQIEYEPKTKKYFITGTQNEVSSYRLCRKGQNPKKLSKPVYKKDVPVNSQDAGNEWSDYAWTADDF